MPALLLGASGCASSDAVLEPPIVPLTEPVHVCVEGSASDCRSVDMVESWFSDEDLSILQVSDTPGGTQGAKVLTLARGHEGRKVVFRAKWRSFATGDLINDPRKEVGAYAVQRLFLESDEYVVPPTATYCFSLASYRHNVDAEADPSLGSKRSVCGVLSYWLPEAMTLDVAESKGILEDDSLIDARLFKADRAYRRSVANLNLFTYLIRHADAHEHQFLLVRHYDDLRAYSVDNSIAFQSVPNPMLLFREDWSYFQVDALPRRSVERIWDVTEEDLEALSTLEQFELVEGAYRRTKVDVPKGDLDDGLRRSGKTLQIGLTRGEIAGLKDRLVTLIERIERDELRTFQ